MPKHSHFQAAMQVYNSTSVQCCTCYTMPRVCILCVWCVCEYPSSKGLLYLIAAVLNDEL